MDYKNAALPIEDRIKDLMGRMTLKEKAAQLGSYWFYQINDGVHLSEDKAEAYLSDGIGQITRVSGASSMRPGEAAAFANEVQHYMAEHTRLGIPAIIHEEACSGFTAAGASIFPQTIGLAASFEPEISEQIGTAIRRQMRAVGAHQALAPLLDVTRDPRWGRTEETYGEDPYLVSQMGCAYIEGIQGDGKTDCILATGKHFVGYGASEGGMNWAPAHIPDRELREVYLAPFEAAVKKSGLSGIMNGYHELDGMPCAANKKLLTGVLKEQWGFQGLVVSDYFAINQLYEYHRTAAGKEEAAKMALEAGMDVELPNVDCFGEPLLQAVEKGDIDIALVDASVEKVLRMKFQLGLFENPYVNADAAEDNFDSKEDRAIARNAARKSLVLLENHNDILPLDSGIKKLAVIGPCADSARNLLGDYTYQGQLEGLLELHENGESAMNQPIPESISMSDHIVRIDSLLTAIKEQVSEETNVRYTKGCDVKRMSKEGFREAVEIAEWADAAIVCVGDLAGITMECTVGESVDRTSLKLPGVQEELIQAVCGTGVPVIVVLTGGRPYALNWEKEHAAAILEAWFPGEEGARAVAEALFGQCVPGGRLPITFPRSSGQIPVFYMHKKSGGRTHWRGDYDDMPASPLYPFGYGLSYTSFAYRDMELDRRTAAIGESFQVSVTIENTGRMDGEEVVQLYIRDEAASVTRPVKELKGFYRVALRAGESKRLTFTLSTAQLGFYNPDMEFVTEPGAVELMLGASSEDIRCMDTIQLTGEVQNMEACKVFTTPVREETI